MFVDSLVAFSRRCINLARIEMRQGLDYPLPMAGKCAERIQILAGVFEPTTRLWDFLTQRVTDRPGCKPRKR